MAAFPRGGKALNIIFGVFFYTLHGLWHPPVAWRPPASGAWEICIACSLCRRLCNDCLSGVKAFCWSRALCWLPCEEGEESPCSALPREAGGAERGPCSLRVTPTPLRESPHRTERCERDAAEIVPCRWA